MIAILCCQLFKRETKDLHDGIKKACEIFSLIPDNQEFEQQIWGKAKLEQQKLNKKKKKTKHGIGICYIHDCLEFPILPRDGMFPWPEFCEFLWHPVLLQVLAGE